MKRFVTGLVIGFLLATTVGVTASSNIRLIINGQEIVSDVPPQLIEGRVMVPARFIAEPLGATVEWNEEKNAVIITNKSETVNTEIEEKNLIHGKELHDVYGITITLIDPKSNPLVYTLSKEDKTIKTTKYHVIENKLYFNKNVLDLFLIQR